MFVLLSIGVLLSLFRVEPAVAEDFQLRLKYRHFDDYLTHMDKKDRAFISGEKVQFEMYEGSGDVESEVLYERQEPVKTRKLPIRTGSTRSKEMTCCMLGQLAGDKGYHCFAKFYAARVMFRNYNRAHNKKIAGLQPKVWQSSARNPAKDSSEKLMRTFTQCVTHRALVFHKCCHLSAIENNPAKSPRVSSGRLVTNRIR